MSSYNLRTAELEENQRRYYELKKQFERQLGAYGYCDNNISDELNRLQPYMNKSYIMSSNGKYCREQNESDSLFSDGY
ncbi:hypothetical protein BMW23_0761 [Bodo saltans virus]|uniref:Uncharacterized protein n=1 Tax=Bodo saltans virus TaxID=2024608 RepID=A0A2H4UVB6_9VIRU|nr:hypothetical protein QJ851_gp0744 [Bodo saltans virus]ATZ80807.1 hypothetical protein BMW23_0761 [Bodo saltans virus]